MYAASAPLVTGWTREEQRARDDDTNGAIDSPCECEHNNNPDSLDARLSPSVVLAVAPAVTMDEASSLSGGREATARRALP